jgi:hypothetical protein
MSVVRHDVARLKQDVPKKLILFLGEVPLFLAHFPPNLSKKTAPRTSFDSSTKSIWPRYDKNHSAQKSVLTA